jgi:N-methylhydantoinase A
MRFDIELPEMKPVLMNLRTTVTGRRPPFDLRLLSGAGERPDTAPAGRRRTYFDGRWHDTALYRRESLPVGAAIEGPAIVEQSDTTTWIDPRASAVTDEFGNLVVTVRP